MTELTAKQKKIAVALVKNLGDIPKTAREVPADRTYIWKLINGNASFNALLNELKFDTGLFDIMSAQEVLKEITHIARFEENVAIKHKALTDIARYHNCLNKITFLLIRW